MKNLSKYNKAIVAVVGVVLTGLNVQFGTDPTVQMVINVAVALGVYRVANAK